MSKIVGKEVRRRRKEKGWSQAQLAVYAESSQPTVNQIESGVRNPSTRTLEKIAQALGVEISDLFPKAQAPLLEEDRQQEGRDAVAALVDEYETLGDALFDRWEEELEQKVAQLAEGDRDAFFRWLREVRDVGRPYINVLIALHTAVTDNKLQAVVGMSPFTQAWGDLRRRIEDAIKEAKKSYPEMKWTQDDDEQVRKMLEGVQAPR